ncbi:hypothetical protein [Pararhizobium sp. O133]|uniref:hypothetical protein n=1 Tax=Pararhizobium sp. O133 TaxID=3449278 RepID=UPI003F6844AF
MTSRMVMMGVYGLVVGAILSILVVQYFAPDDSNKSTTPPNPLVVTPENAAQETE